MTKKAHSERKTRASTRTKPVLSKSHPQDVAHPATAEREESDSEKECYSVASLSETAHSQLPLSGSVTQGREQILGGQGRDSDGLQTSRSLDPTSERAKLGRRSSQFGTRSGVPAFSLRLEDADDESDGIFFTLKTEA